MQYTSGFLEPGNVKDSKLIVVVKADLDHARSDIRHRPEIRRSLASLN
jgi:hypothetical protein